ncbi:MAG: hypothetical protein HYW23_00810 [Candidatus Aenigmarchaeota archaeon]|nr:hypothetical protein [Candidatus Aenigmarchaeota archaeon]
MINRGYYFPAVDIKTLKSMRESQQAAMEKYGCRTWWRSRNPYVVVHRQIEEPVLLVNFDQLQQYLGEVLGRPIYTDDLISNYRQLKRVARSMISRHVREFHRTHQK